MMRKYVYISYSHSENEHRMELREVLKRDVRLDSLIWDDLEIQRGEDGELEIQTHVVAARIMIMLVSPSFLNRTECQAWQYEIPQALDARDAGELTVIWIPARKVDVAKTPFEKIHSAHQLSRPLDTLDKEQRQEVYQSLRNAIVAELGLEAPDSFDVFLSHNSKDKPAVRELKEELSKYGINSWYDEEQLRPGVPWQGLLEEGIRNSKSVAVIIGRDGCGPWEDEEMQAALQLAVRDRRPVIPILLPDASDQPNLPMFLGNRTWIDLRKRPLQEPVRAPDLGHYRYKARSQETNA